MQLFTAKKSPIQPSGDIARIIELAQVVTDVQVRLQACQYEQKRATDELVPLLAAQRRNDTERPRLVQIRQSAQFALEEAAQRLARSIGKVDEAQCIEQHQQAEQALAGATEALAACDRQFDRAKAYGRIQELREALQAEEQRERELSIALGKTREVRRIISLTALYTALQAVYEVFEHGGAAIESMRNHQMVEYEQVLRDICIDRYELADLLVQRFNLDEPDYRPELRARQQSVKDELAKLKN